MTHFLGNGFVDRTFREYKRERPRRVYLVPTRLPLAVNNDECEWLRRSKDVVLVVMLLLFNGKHDSLPIMFTFVVVRCDDDDGVHMLFLLLLLMLLLTASLVLLTRFSECDDDVCWYFFRRAREFRNKIWMTRFGSPVCWTMRSRSYPSGLLSMRMLACSTRSWSSVKDVRTRSVFCLCLPPSSLSTHRTGSHDRLATGRFRNLMKCILFRLT